MQQGALVIDASAPCGDTASDHLRYAALVSAADAHHDAPFSKRQKHWAPLPLSGRPISTPMMEEYLSNIMLYR